MNGKRISIRTIGLSKYLEMTRDSHKGLGWADFKQRMDMHLPKTRIAEDFNISKQTVWSWVHVYKEQQNA